MVVKYVLMIVSYAVLGGLALRLVAQEHPEPAAALAFTGVWLLGFVWVSGYALWGRRDANQLTLLVLAVFSAFAVMGGVMWAAMDLL
jgi:predicted membrane metal-binding protein